MALIRRALTIAGSDSGGCAGIQADLKTFAALGVHGLTAITSVTAQNTQRVVSATELPPSAVEAQIRAVVEDIGVDAVKTGMLSSAPIISAVASAVSRYSLAPLVVDPVMVSTAGDRLLEISAIEVLKDELLPLAEVATPNLPEAEELVGSSLSSRSAVVDAAKLILSWGPRAVIVKGGHGKGDQAIDYLVDESGLLELAAPRVPTRNTHGSGCTFSAALTAHLAKGLALREAAQNAKEYVTAALRKSYDLGRGAGPLGHFWWAEKPHES